MITLREYIANHGSGCKFRVSVWHNTEAAERMGIGVRIRIAMEDARCREADPTEPVYDTPEEALAAAMNSGVDYLLDQPGLVKLRPRREPSDSTEEKNDGQANTSS